MRSPPRPDTASSSVAIAPPAEGPGMSTASPPPAAAASLGGLPPELLLRVIAETLPEGFESLALSCRALHKLCEPFIEHHNMLRAQFDTFYYRPFPREVPQDPLWRPIRHGCDLLARIAAEPVVARYIRHADLSWDNWPPNRVIPPSLADADDGDDPVVALFANSPYLERANLDWRQYYSLIGDDYARDRTTQQPYYSQHAAAFVLTLLPNARSLMLPRNWAPTPTSYQLVNAIISDAREPHSPQQQHGPSLAQVTRFDTGSHTGAHHMQLVDVVPFLALPQVRSAHCPGSEATGMRPGDLTLKQPQARFGETLENVYLSQACVDNVAMADFLRSTPRLKTLELGRTVPEDEGPQDWDVGEFLRILEREAGDRIEQLSIRFHAAQGGTVTPAHLSFRGGFPRLRALVLDFAVLGATLSHASSRLHKPVGDFTAADLEAEALRLGDLLPASLAQLVVVAEGEEREAHALRALFHSFGARKAEQLPALEMIELEASWDYDNHPAYESECKRLLSETDPAGVVLSTEPSDLTCEWDGGEDWESAD